MCRPLTLISKQRAEAPQPTISQTTQDMISLVKVNSTYECVFVEWIQSYWLPFEINSYCAKCTSFVLWKRFGDIFLNKKREKSVHAQDCLDISRRNSVAVLAHFDVKDRRWITGCHPRGVVPKQQ